MPDKEVQAAVMTRMRQLYPNATVPEPVAFHITRWGQDPLARGCYSAYKPGFDDDDYSTPDRMARQVEQWKPGQAVVLSRQLRLNLNGTEAGCVERFGPAAASAAPPSHNATARRR